MHAQGLLQSCFLQKYGKQERTDPGGSLHYAGKEFCNCLHKYCSDQKRSEYKICDIFFSGLSPHQKALSEYSHQDKDEEERKISELLWKN